MWMMQLGCLASQDIPKVNLHMKGIGSSWGLKGIDIKIDGIPNRLPQFVGLFI